MPQLFLIPRLLLHEIISYVSDLLEFITGPTLHPRTGKSSCLEHLAISKSIKHFRLQLSLMLIFLCIFLSRNSMNVRHGVLRTVYGKREASGGCTNIRRSCGHFAISTDDSNMMRPPPAKCMLPCRLCCCTTPPGLNQCTSP